MTAALPQSLSLEQFLTLPFIEESPAWEFLQGEASQKPMPGGKHSRLQASLATAINQLESSYEAFPELRCTFGGRSIVPDLVILEKTHIPLDERGEITPNGLATAPDWMIEILSPEQGAMKVTRKILHSLRHGGQMGWLIDPDERVVLLYRPGGLPEELTGDAQLPGLPGIAWSLTVDQL